MALSKGGSGEDKTFINLKLVSVPGPVDGKQDAPYFDRQEDFKSTGDRYTNVTGKLIKIKSTHTPAKGKMGDIYGFKAFFEDGSEIYVVESTITNASKDLLNALLANIGEVLNVSLYLNKNQYPTSSVKLANGNYAQTSFDFQEARPEALFTKIQELEAASQEASETDLDKVFG